MNQTSVQSKVTSVVVYARGAVVTRQASLPAELTKDPVELVLPGLTADFDPGSVRASLQGRDVVTVRSSLTLPQEAPRPAGDAAEVERLDRAISRLRLETEELSARLQQLQDAEIAVDLDNRRDVPDPDARVRDTLTTSALVEAQVLKIERRLLDIADEDRALRRRRETAAADTKHAAASANTTPVATRTAIVQLAKAGDAASGNTLTLEYTIPGARWWPAYAARLEDGGRKATWTLDAFVAQASNEDWTNVRLSVATSDLVRDVGMPKLSSLRFGRAQGAQRRPPRPPPVGLDELFVSFEMFRIEFGRPASIVPAPMAPPPPRSRASDGYEAATYPSSAARDEDEVEAALESRFVEKSRKKLSKPAPAPAAPPPPMPRAAAPGRAPSAPPPPSAAPMMMQASMKMKSSSGGGGIMKDIAEELDEGAALGGMAFGAAAPEPEPETEVGDQWLDFDSLVLASGDDRSDVRGKLRRSFASDAPGRAERRARIDLLAAPHDTTDPIHSRGLFDARYDAANPVDIPSSDTRTTRVTLRSATAAPVPKLVVVPRENTDVFRSSEMPNPFDQPLLPGPCDVFIDGALVTTSPIDAVDRAGVLSLPIGVEDRVRVARNARAREETTGLISSSAVVTHDVTIELSSSLGYAVSVEVRERLPVTDDKDLEVTLVSARPAAEKYTQADRDAPIRGGQRWKVEVAAGGKAKVEYAYRLAFSGKSEVVGGNRRE